jgi:hypothetical protein
MRRYTEAVAEAEKKARIDETEAMAENEYQAWKRGALVDHDYHWVTARFEEFVSAAAGQGSGPLGQVFEAVLRRAPRP